MSHTVARLIALPIAFVAAVLSVLLTPFYRVGVFVFALVLAGFVVLWRNAMQSFQGVAASIARPRV